MFLTVQGLVIRVKYYNDTDAFLTVLTRDMGRLTVKARGVKRKNSPLIATCQLLAYCEFTLFENRGYYTINEAQSIELFMGLRRDLQMLSLGTYFAEVAELVCQEDIPDPCLLSLVLNCLYALSKLELPEAQVKSVFELRVACLAGYTPNLDGCFNCGKETAEAFDLSMGHLECVECNIRNGSGIRMPLSIATLAAMRYICTCNEKKLFSFQANRETLQELSNITESYLTTQLERGFSTLDFYKSLLFHAGAVNGS